MADSSPIRDLLIAQLNGGYSETRLLGMALDQKDSAYQRHIKECRVCSKLADIYLDALVAGRDTANMPQQCRTADVLEKTYIELRKI